MLNKNLILAAAMALSTIVFAHDADTLAFYAFKEGAAETSLDGVTVLNDVGAAYPGTLTLGTSASDTVVYKADVPGSYVFDSDAYCSTPLCSNPQSVYFAGGKGGDQKLFFADLATAISSNENYTVEFFVKLRPEDKTMNTWTAMLQMDCGMLYNPKPGSEAETALAGTPQTTGVFFNGNLGQNLYTYVRSATYHPALSQASYNKCAYYNTGATYFDGYWHHYALVYTVSNHKLSHYLDYGLVTSSYTTTNSVLDVANPVSLGNGGFRGWISCLRVSKTARATSAFLRCSSEPTYVPETIFHWRLDGENGADAKSVTNICAVNILKGQYVELTSGACDGHGTAISWTNDEEVAVFPVYTNEIPFPRKPFVMYGDTKVGENAGSARLTAQTRTTSPFGVGGAGLMLATSDHYPISSGDFTMEAWMKFDHATWKTKMIDSGVAATVKRVALFGMYNSGRHFEWQLALNYQSDGYKVQLDAYDPSWSMVEGAVRPTVNYLMDDKWHHFAVVYDDSQYMFTAYVDGGAVTNATLETAFRPHTSTQQYQIGYGLNNCAFEGLVDEVRFVRRALSPSEFLSFSGRRGTKLVFR